jgi:uroporphyrinogen-III synthase
VSRRARSSTALAGLTVLVTRPADASAELVRELERRGARSISAPAIEIVPARSAALTRALRDLAAGRYMWMTLTSARTVEVLSSRIDPTDVRARVAVIGDGTAEAFRSWSGRRPDLVPRAFTTVGLARAFPRGRGRVLCARADVAPEGLEQALAEKGWTAERLEAYRTRVPRRLPREASLALAAGEVDAITFTSASTVRGFVGAVGEVRGSPRVVCIGPVTSKEARAHGLRVDAVADPHTVQGLVAALENLMAKRARRPATGDAGADRAGRATIAT